MNCEIVDTATGQKCGKPASTIWGSSLHMCVQCAIDHSTSSLEYRLGIIEKRIDKIIEYLALAMEDIERPIAAQAVRELI